MILIVGGVCQGKLAFAKTLAEQEREKGKMPEIIDHFEESLLKQQQEGGNWEIFIRTLLEEGQDPIVILREMGCGIVPMDPFERQTRDLVGRAGQQLAAEADQVYRVICGIGTRIK